MRLLSLVKLCHFFGRTIRLTVSLGTVGFAALPSNKAVGNCRWPLLAPTTGSISGRSSLAIISWDIGACQRLTHCNLLLCAARSTYFTDLKPSSHNNELPQPRKFVACIWKTSGVTWLNSTPANEPRVSRTGTE